MKSTQYQKANRDVLIEWTYDDNNSIQEPYKIITDERTFLKQYVAGDTTLTRNNVDNQLFKLDPLTNRFTKLDLNNYNFFTVQDLVDPDPVIHDKIRIYFPSNWIFGEYQGLFLRLYTKDGLNRICDLSNFFFDVTDLSTSSYLKTDISPALEYQERLWNKMIEIDVPSLYHVSRVAVDPVYFLDTSVNFRLSGGVGLSKESPIFVEFRFINRISTLGGIKYYNMSNSTELQFPQRPEMEGVKLVVNESRRGDYFEIFGTVNNTFLDFVDFIETSQRLGKVYSLEFTITTFEDNRAGKSIKYVIDQNFNDIVEYRPILRQSSRTAVLDVEMRLVDLDSGQITTKKAIYGLKPDQISKYSVNLKKVNVRNTFKPKIYQKVRTSDYQFDKIGRNSAENRVRVPVPELKTITQPPQEIVASSNAAANVVQANKMENYHGLGKLKISVVPFDNIINFSLYLKSQATYEPFDLTNCQDLRLIFKGDEDSLDIRQFITPENSAPTLGICEFKIKESEFVRLQNIYQKGGKLFYITCTNQGIRCMIYSGLYTIKEPTVVIPQNLAEPTQMIIPTTTTGGGVALVSRKVAEPNRPQN